MISSLTVALPTLRAVTCTEERIRSIYPVWQSNYSST